jgi:hypothetical protein
MCELFGLPDSEAKSATGRLADQWVLGFPQVEHLFKTAHQAGHKDRILDGGCIQNLLSTSFGLHLIRIVKFS